MQLCEMHQQKVSQLVSQLVPRHHVWLSVLPGDHGVIASQACRHSLWTHTCTCHLLHPVQQYCTVMFPRSSSIVQGVVQEYWEVYDSHPHLQGGFIWDWVDQGLINTATDASGIEMATPML